MRYIVYDAGELGGPLGVYLWESGRETLLIARGSNVERIQADGLTLATPEGRRVVKVPAVRHPSEAELCRATSFCSG